MTSDRPATVVVAHPAADLYGSDRQLLESVRAMVEGGLQVHVVLPEDGPLRPLLQEAGSSVRLLPVPVLRKSLLSPRGMARLALHSPPAVAAGRRLLRSVGADALYVNTVTLPTWVAAGTAARVPTLCHVHEAESDRPAAVRAALAAPLLLADRIVTNSAAARDTVTSALPCLSRRSVVVHNGVPGPPGPVLRRPPVDGRTVRLALVGRLSPRKGIDVALEALALLGRSGRSVELVVCGSAFHGYEWYESELRRRAGEPDLVGKVSFTGYVHPTWSVLADSDIVLVPSRAEPFGNTAVEGMLAGRPVIASSVQGLREVLDDGRTGLLVPPGDPARLAEAIEGLLADPSRGAALAAAGRAEALARFSTERYREAIRQELDGLGAVASPPRPYST